MKITKFGRPAQNRPTLALVALAMSFLEEVRAREPGSDSSHGDNGFVKDRGLVANPRPTEGQ